MEWLLLILIIMMTAVAVAYSGEIYLYLSLVFGSMIRDIQDKINSIIGRKK
jgi:ABC-type Fe3+-siderophore transport system permease subunit